MLRFERILRTAADNGIRHGREAALHLLKEVLHLRGSGKNKRRREIKRFKMESRRSAYEDREVLRRLRRVATLLESGC